MPGSTTSNRFSYTCVRQNLRDGRKYVGSTRDLRKRIAERASREVVLPGMEAGKKPAVFVFTTAYHPFIGGAEIAIQEVARRLAGDFDFFIFTARFRRDLARREERPEGTIIRVGFGGEIGKLLLPFLGALHVLRLMRERRPALFWPVMATFASGVPYLINIVRFWDRVPVVLTLQEGDSEAHIRHSRLGLIGLAWRLALRRTDFLTTISAYLGDLASRYGYHGRAEIIPNGVALERFRIVSRLTGRKPTVITVSRLVSKNGVDILIRAIAELQRTRADVRVLVVGGGPERQSLQELARSLHVEDRVQFFGTVPYEAVPQHLAAADVFVRASRSEGMGNAFVEALAAGLPIIGTPVGGIPDIIREGETGLFCRVDDSRDLAQKIELLLADRALAGRIVKHGQAMVAERFSWDSIARSYRQTFERLLEQPPTRILIATGIFPPDIGGPATYSALLAEELPKRSYQVSIVTYAESENPKPQIPITKQIPNPKIQNYAVVRVPRRLPKGARHIWYFCQCLRLGRRADIVFAQDTVSAGLPAMLAAKLLKRPLVIRIAGDYAWEQGVMRFGVADRIDAFQEKRYGWRVEGLRKLQGFVARSADAIVVPSRYLQGIVRGWAAADSQIVVIPNAVELPSPLPSRKEARRVLGIPRTAAVLVSAGRLVPWKGFAALIDVIPALLAEHPGARLFIAGDGPERGHLELKIRNLGLTQRVHLLGALPREQFFRYLTAADVFVLNTGYEGFSHQILEAMAVGTAVATTRSGGNAEIVRDGENGLMFGYNQKSDMTRAITHALDDASLRERLTQNGFLVRERFSVENMLRALSRVL